LLSLGLVVYKLYSQSSSKQELIDAKHKQLEYLQMIQYFKQEN